MANFMIRFLLCNIALSGITLILLLIKRLFKNSLSGRMQYNLWFLLLGMLALPFLPLRLFHFPDIFSLFQIFINPAASNAGAAVSSTSPAVSSSAADWIEDFTLSVGRSAPSSAGLILAGIWLAGVLIMIRLAVRSKFRLNTLKKSSLPLQNREVYELYKGCLDEMKITVPIPIRSTAFLRSPVITGLFKPCIYVPIHLISDYHPKDMRYMLLHELQHCKHRDALANYLMNLAGILYWFNPFIWYFLSEMKNDREAACDISVLQMLNKESWPDYGNTLINFAEKVSLTPFPFSAGLSGNMRQMRRRIAGIASYERPSVWKKIRGMAAFGMTAILLMGFAPLLSSYAADTDYYRWNPSSKQVSCPDLSSFFSGCEGSFVLYDLEKDSWHIYDKNRAAARVSPDSTYKIYDALFGLESGIITPENSSMAWNKEIYPFETWNADQTLQSAMESSVNWYFQALDKKLGRQAVTSYIHKIEYGNESAAGDISSYWMESTLKISPIEQVELLTGLYRNDWDFSPENINAVKNSLLISSSETGNFYGKTGTGRVNGADRNGWFVGYAESPGHTCFFATNIQSGQNATGSRAFEITQEILSQMGIWQK